MKAYSLSQLYEMKKINQTTVNHEVFIPIHVVSSITGECFELVRELYDCLKLEVKDILSPGSPSPSNLDLSRPVMGYSLTVGDFIKAVYLECKMNIWFFLKEFCYITTNEGVSKFLMTPEAYIMVDTFNRQLSHLMYYIRQTGASTTLAAMIVWLKYFHPIRSLNILTMNTTSREFLERIISDISSNLPNAFSMIISPSHFNNKNDLPAAEHEYFFIDNFEFIEDISELERILTYVIANPDHSHLVAASTMNSKFEGTSCYKMLMNSAFLNPNYIDTTTLVSFMRRMGGIRSVKKEIPIIISALDEHLIFPDDQLTIRRQMFHNDDVYRNEYCPRDVMIDRAERRKIRDDGSEVIPGVRAIAAVDKNFGIGYDGRLLFDIRDDKRFFKTMTKGNMVIMGRKTMESLPGMRPLSDRINVVITRNPSEMTEKYPDGFFFCTIESVLDTIRYYLGKSGLDGYVYIIGGESIYQQMLKYCEEVYLTEVSDTFKADTFFPHMHRKDIWKREIFMESPEGAEPPYKFTRYTRIKPNEIEKIEPTNTES